MVSMSMNIVYVLLGIMVLAVAVGVVIGLVDVRRSARPAAPAAPKRSEYPEVTQEAA